MHLRIDTLLSSFICISYILYIYIHFDIKNEIYRFVDNKNIRNEKCKTVFLMINDYSTVHIKDLRNQQ